MSDVIWHHGSNDDVRRRKKNLKIHVRRHITMSDVRCLWASFLLAMTVVALNAAVVVVNREVTDENITEERVRDFLLERSTSWSSGDPVVIILCTDTGGEKLYQKSPVVQ